MPKPPQKLLHLNRVFENSGAPPNADLVAEYLYRRGKLSKELSLEILRTAASVLGNEPNLLRIEGKVTIIGDLHG